MPRVLILPYQVRRARPEQQVPELLARLVPRVRLDLPVPLERLEMQDLREQRVRLVLVARVRRVRRALIPA